MYKNVVLSIPLYDRLMKDGYAEGYKYYYERFTGLYNIVKRIPIESIKEHPEEWEYIVVYRDTPKWK